MNFFKRFFKRQSKKLLTDNWLIYAGPDENFLVWDENRKNYFPVSDEKQKEILANQEKYYAEFVRIDKILGPGYKEI